VLRDGQYFGDEDLDLIFIAKKLREAKELEEVLTRAGLDYLIETDTYLGGFLFRAERVGAFFYVRPADAQTARGMLVKTGFRPYVPEGAMGQPSD